MELPINQIVEGDCLEVMAEWSDNCVDAIVTDPPYGIGEAAGRNNSRGKWAPAKDYGCKDWDSLPPPAEAFALMQRVSQEQVIFGGIYFANHLPPSSSWVVWDKDNGCCDFADCELAWTSHKRAVRKIKWRWQGMLQQPGYPKDKRFHPTQKPLGMMCWVIENYTGKDDLILDPYCGSGTTLLACQRLGRRFIGIEKEAEYCEIARKRLADDTPLLQGGSEKARGKFF